jgi:hypothetical protein
MVPLAVIVSGVALLVAVVGVVTGLGTLALYELDVIGADASANLGVASILCSLISIPIGFVGWRWAEKRGQQPLIGQAAALTGAGTFVGWFVLFVYALGKDTP